VTAVLAIDTPPAGESMLQRLTGFIGALRDNGFKIGLAEAQDGARILADPLARRPEYLEQAFKALFASRLDDWQKFDEIFAAYWLGRGMKRVIKVSGAPPKEAPKTIRQMADAGAPKGEPGIADDPERRAESETENPADGRGRREGASIAESLERTDFRHIADPEKLARAQEIAERLARVMRSRLTRRDRHTRHGRRLDMRRTIRASIAHGGTPIELAFRRRKKKPVKLIVMLDASGSMSLYTAVFTRFIRGVVGSFRASEAYVFHTRLVQVSDALREKNATRAIERLSLMATGIGGGTRIGECLASFNRRHAKRVITSRTAVMILSDGYDTGAPERLGQEMAALARRCRRIVWLNPMIGWQGYQPVARGMAAALPHVDLFAPAHNLESLARLEHYLARL
jgi:uncharacterized protein with von Willebrand factor type A (vWA) domain